MTNTLRAMAAVVAGMTLAMALVVAIEAFSEIVHPAARFHGNVPEQVRQYPLWVLGVVVVAYGGTAAAATWVASRVGNRISGGIVAILLTWALVFNLVMLPYTLWFKFAMTVVFPIACVLGIRFGRRLHQTANR
jgi:predicted MFS family arabinose efflux permease